MFISAELRLVGKSANFGLSWIFLYHEVGSLLIDSVLNEPPPQNHQITGSKT